MKYSLTDGNLSRHLTVLQDAGIVEAHKGVMGKRPQTLCRLSDRGRKRYLEYIRVLENVIADAVATSRAISGRAAGAANSEARRAPLVALAPRPSRSSRSPLVALARLSLGAQR